MLVTIRIQRVCPSLGAAGASDFCAFPEGRDLQ
jgi:hypothetical protein